MRNASILSQIRRGKEFIISLNEKEYRQLRSVDGNWETVNFILANITNQSGGVYGKDGSLDVDALNVTPYVMARAGTDLRENDRLICDGTMWTVGAPSFPHPAGVDGDDVSVVQAPVVFNGEHTE